MALKHLFSITCVFFIFSVLTSADYDGGNNLIPKLKPQKESLLSTTIGIQGMIYCKSGKAKPIPLEGGVVRITCLAIDQFGYETSPFSFLSDTTNKDGYFFATLCPTELWENRKMVKECRAFLELSSMETCDIPTDINKGISGALLSSYKLLKEKKVKVFTVGPFFYTSEPKPVSNDGY